jgi:DNA-binding CsgD family transcriptional regulator
MVVEFSVLLLTPSNWFILFVIADILLFISLALLCRRDGDRTQPIISAFYTNAMLILIDFTTSGFITAFFGLDNDLNHHVTILIQFLLNLLWVVFYSYIARKITTSIPIVFSLLLILMPVIALIIAMSIFFSISHTLGEEGKQIVLMESGLFLYGALFSTLIIAANMCIFYFYVRVSVAYESLRFAQTLANTPPVWTAEHGLSDLFIEKYQITTREQQVIEILIRGKTDKEISIMLECAVNTVQSHLKRIYRKTGATNRFALSALVRGE